MTKNTSTSRKFSILSAVLSFLSLILGVVSFGLPYWIYFDDVIIISISGTTNNVRMKFHYGFWSYCNDVSTSTQTLNSCGQVKTHSDQEQLTICLVMLSIILSVNAFVNTCLYLLLMRNEKMCLYVTAASALLSGLLSAAADINYGVQDHTAKISTSYTLPFSLSNLSIAFWLSIVNCIIISLSAVFTVIALYYHGNKDVRDDISTGSSRQSIYQYEKEVQKDALPDDDNDIYDQKPYQSPGYDVFDDDLSDEDIKKPLCGNSQDSTEILIKDGSSLGKRKSGREPSIEIDDNTKQADGYVSGVWSELEKHNNVYESSDTESLTPAVNDESTSQRSQGTIDNSSRSILISQTDNRHGEPLMCQGSRPTSSASGIVNRTLSTHSANSQGDKDVSNLRGNTDFSPVNGNYEVFLLPNDQTDAKLETEENAKGYFIPDNDMTTFKPSKSPGINTERTFNSYVAEKPETDEIENTSYSTMRRPEFKASSKGAMSKQNITYLGQQTTDVSPYDKRTMTPVSIDAGGMFKDSKEKPELPTTNTDLDSLAGYRPSLRDYPDTFSLLSQSGRPPLDTRIQSDTNEGKMQESDVQMASAKDNVDVHGSVKSNANSHESIRSNIKLLNGNDTVTLNESIKGVEANFDTPKKIEIDIAGVISRVHHQAPEQGDTTNPVLKDGDVTDSSKIPITTETAQKSTKRKKISIKFNVAPPVQFDENSTIPKKKTVRKTSFGRIRKPNSTRPKQPSVTSRPPTARSLIKQPSMIMDENNPYSGSGIALKREESKFLKEGNEVTIMPKKELVKKAAYKRLKQSYQCKLPRMYNTEKQDIFRKLAKIHSESTVVKQGPSKVAAPKSPSIRPKTSKRRLSPSPPRIKIKHAEHSKLEEEAWLEDDGIPFSEV